METPRVFIAVPNYGGRLLRGAAHNIFLNATVHEKMELIAGTSLLTMTFNSLWCTALNMRSQGITHLAMLHDDIEPEAFWVDTLIEEMDRVGADIISAVVPLKSGDGMTSTAVESFDPWRPRRLTMTELSNLPETFDAADIAFNEPGSPLLINTGCMLCKFTDEWIERVCFHIEDAIVKAEDGTFRPCVIPEDWGFSRWAHRQGLKVAATTKVRLTHMGDARFPNYGVWGKATDEMNRDMMGAVKS